MRVEDHPLDYRTFEGTIPQGEYGGGTVMLWDEGWWEPLVDVEQGLREGDLKFALHGHRLKGAWVLVHMKPKKGERDVNWLLIKEKDDYVRADAGIDGSKRPCEPGAPWTRSRAGKTRRSPRTPSTTWTSSWQAGELDAPGDNWLFEVKYDGYRIVAYVEGGRARLVTRNGNDYTRHFPTIARSLEDWAAGRAWCSTASSW